MNQELEKYKKELTELIDVFIAEYVEEKERINSFKTMTDLVDYTITGHKEVERLKNEIKEENTTH